MVSTMRPRWFDDDLLPTPEAELAGYAWLINEYSLRVPAPEQLVVIVPAKNTRQQKGRWLLMGSRYQPEASWFQQLTFAFKYEGVDLAILKKLFEHLSENEIFSAITKQITGAYSRRIWFFYEWLTGRRLPIKDASAGNYVNALNEELQFGCAPRKVVRQRVNNNLPGVSTFCPLIRKTDALTDYIEQSLEAKATRCIGNIPRDLLARAAAFLLLSDSKASYTIEGETPAYTRIERWSKIIGQAGTRPLTVDEIERLQDVVIPDKRFVMKGIRCIGGFIGEHDRVTNAPLPEHISAKPEDLDELLNAYFDAYEVMKTTNLHPVLVSAVIAFAFVFIHPLEDGNGRIHRYLIHHVLADTGFTPKGLTFPVSAVILEHIENYKSALERFTRPRLKYIDWYPTEDNNVRVTNETIDLYRYGDMTAQAEFLFSCVKETIDEVLPQEVHYLKCYDEVWNYLNNRFDMPQKTLSLLMNFLRQGNGQLSKRARAKEFLQLSDDEVNAIESKYQEVFTSSEITNGKAE